MQKRAEERRTRVEELARERDKLRESRARLEKSMAESRATATGILECHDAKDGSGLQALLVTANEQVGSLEHQLAAERDTLPSEEMDPDRLAETVAQALKDIGERERELLARRGGARRVIARARTEARYERLTQTEERLAAARAELHGTWRRAQAVKLLRHLVEARRGEITSGALPGLEEKLARMFRHITGRNRPMRMDETMAVTRLVDGEAERDSEDLSSGAREQLDLVTRVVLGETYAEHFGRTTMVLDDALLYTDPRRHDRVKQILQRAGDRLQIFILTSHPERYRGIVPAEFQFDLESIAAQ